jgi:hypothetical protein
VSSSYLRLRCQRASSLGRGRLFEVLLALRAATPARAGTGQRFRCALVPPGSIVSLPEPRPAASSFAWLREASRGPPPGASL